MCSSLALIALVCILVSAGVQDAREREIANWKNAAIALLAPLWWWSIGLAFWPDMMWQVGLALIVFAVFCGAFQFGWMGGGDVKMIGALALWLPFAALARVLVLMSLIGGLITVVMMIERVVRRRGRQGASLPIEVPYGVAIAMAALTALPRTIS